MTDAQKSTVLIAFKGNVVFYDSGNCRIVCQHDKILLQQT